MRAGIGEGTYERDRMENLGVDGRIILEWVLKKEDEMTWSDRAL
jgi:hypothetical protein